MDRLQTSEADFIDVMLRPTAKDGADPLGLEEMLLGPGQPTDEDIKDEGSVLADGVVPIIDMSRTHSSGSSNSNAHSSAAAHAPQADTQYADLLAYYSYPPSAPPLVPSQVPWQMMPVIPSVPHPGPYQPYWQPHQPAMLKLDATDAIAHLGCEASPADCHQPDATVPHTAAQAYAGMVPVVDAMHLAFSGMCHPADRKARLNRYQEKRRRRTYEKTIRYESRKAYAEVRPRIKGRFATRAEVRAMKAAAPTGPTADVTHSEDMDADLTE